MKQTYDNYYKEYYQKNRDRIRANRKEKYYNLAKNREYTKKARELSLTSYTREWTMWHGAKNRALQGGLPFNIELSDVKIPKLCPILGIELDTDYSDKSKKTSPSLDRIIPDLGYVKGNVAVISFQANRMKQNLTMPIIHKLVAYIKKEYDPVEVRINK